MDLVSWMHENIVEQKRKTEQQQKQNRRTETTEGKKKRRERKKKQCLAVYKQIDVFSLGVFNALAFASTANSMHNK